MNYFKQYREMLDAVEDENVKTQLSEGLSKLQGIFDDAIETRDKTKEKARSQAEILDSIAKQFGVEEVTVEALKGTLDKGGKDDEIKSKYESQLEELRGIIAEKENAIGSVNAKYSDMVFSSQIESMGLLSGFKENPLLKKQVIEHLKSSLVHQDGKLYVRDENGEAAKDIKTGEFISPTKLVEGMKSDQLWADFIAPTVATGGGMTQSGRQAPVNVELSATELMKQARR